MHKCYLSKVETQQCVITFCRASHTALFQCINIPFTERKARTETF